MNGNSETIGLILQLVFGVGLGLLLLGIGFFAGRWAESRHLASLSAREAELSGVMVTDFKSFPGGADPGAHGAFVVGEAVISSDYFKTFLSSIRKIIGGEMRSYQRLLDRARREATVRMLKDARARGFDAVCNVRYEGYDIAAGVKAGNKPVVSVAVQAFGTAYRRAGGAGGSTGAEGGLGGVG